MVTLKIKTPHFLSPSPNLFSPHHHDCYCSFFSTWFSPPSQEEDPILSTISEAIKNTTPTKPLDTSLKKLLPSLTARHVINLINLNPHFLSPPSLLSFFKWVSSQPNFRHTIHSYCTMTHFLCSHQLLSEAQSLLRFVVSRKGKDSASSVFTAILETRDYHGLCIIVEA